MGKRAKRPWSAARRARFEAKKRRPDLGYVGFRAGEYQKAQAALRRGEAARGHLHAATVELDAARADLSACVMPSTELSDLLAKLHENIQAAIVVIAQDAERWKLDHAPSVAELRRGHGPRHGCGKKGQP